MGVVQLDSDYYGFVIEHGVCSIQMRFGAPITNSDMRSAMQVTQIFLIFLIKWRSTFWDDEEEVGRQDDGQAQRHSITHEVE